jgi:hypothetical protein
MSILITSASLSDIAVINTLIPPVAGTHVGGGIHVNIPPNYVELILSGVQVAGCSYVTTDSSGSLMVPSNVQLALANTAITQNINSAQLAVFTGKLNAAIFLDSGSFVVG